MKILIPTAPKENYVLGITAPNPNDWEDHNAYFSFDELIQLANYLTTMGAQSTGATKLWNVIFSALLDLVEVEETE